MYSYVDYDRKSNLIYIWEYDKDGKKHLTKERYVPHFYVENSDGKHKSMFGKTLKRIDFSSYRDYANAKYSYKDSFVQLYEADLRTEDRFCIDRYVDVDIENNIPVMNTFFIDIETAPYDGSFADLMSTADAPVSLITLYSTKYKKYMTLGLYGDYETDRKDVSYKRCDSEVELLSTVVKIIGKFNPDCIVGWNSNAFDIPYLIKRIKKVLGDGAELGLSPIRKVNVYDKKDDWGGVSQRYKISGVNLLDYMEMYKKYCLNDRENFRLDFIAKTELNVGKIIDINFKKQKENWQKFVEYNIRDVELIVKLDEKLNYLNVVYYLCYGGRMPFDQYDTTVRLLDGTFLTETQRKGIVAPDRISQHNVKNISFEGGYVKVPKNTNYNKWVVSWDITSMYPSIMRMLNISPETLVATIPSSVSSRAVLSTMQGKITDDKDIDVVIGDKHVDMKISEIVKWIKDNKYQISGVGSIFKNAKEERGLLPSILDGWFIKRKADQKIANDAKKIGDDATFQKFYIMQYAQKIRLNSVFGYVGCMWSRFFNLHNARSITVTGQQIIKSNMNMMNCYVGKEIGKNKAFLKYNIQPIGEDITLYGDTDSCYFNYYPLVKQISEDETKHQQICKQLDTFFEKLFSNFNNSYNKKIYNVDNLIVFEREIIASGAIFLKKKRYTCHVVDDGGMSVDKVQIKGMDIIKSSTCSLARNSLRVLMKDILVHGDEKKTKDVLRGFHETFLKSTCEDIAFPRSMNNLKKWNKDFSYDDFSYKSGCPIQVKASIFHNYLIKELKLENKYDMITEGSKIYFTYIKGNQQNNAVAFQKDYPEEFKKILDVDINSQWEKQVIKPMEQIFDAMSWSMPNFLTADTDDLFG